MRRIQHYQRRNGVALQVNANALSWSRVKDGEVYESGFLLAAYIPKSAITMSLLSSLVR